MARPWSHRLVAIGLIAATMSASPLESGALLAQAPSASSLPHGEFLADMSGFGLPDEADMATDVDVTIADEPPAPPDIGLAAIAARAAAIVEATDGTAWNLGPLSERLEYAPFAAFMFVRDSIGYDPYPGVLRGPLGTLLARSGNDIDRASLLQELLDRMVIPSRLVVGTLDEPTISALLARSFVSPSQPLAPAPIDPQELGDLSALSARARRDYALVRGALGDRDMLMDGSANTAAAAEARQHVWVQMRFGTEWLDLDPSMPDSQPGQTLTSVSTVLGDIPDEWRDTVTIRVIAERLSDGVLSEQTVLEHQFDAAPAARQDIYLTMSPVGDSIGDSINAALGSGAGWRPTLSVGEDSFPGEPFPVVPESDILSGVQSGAETSALRLEVTVNVPGSEPETIRRTLVDRLSAAARAGSSIAQSELAPLTMRQQVPVELSPILHFQVSTGGFDIRSHQVWRQIAAVFSELMAEDPTLAAEYGFPGVMLPMTVADESLVQASERLISDGLDGAQGTRAFIARPRVFLTSVGPTADDGRITTTTDLMTDTVRILVGDGQDAVGAAHGQLWYGALEGALESEFLLSRIAAGGLSGGHLGGVSFGLTGQPILLTPDGPAIPSGASSALARDIASGALAVVPGDVLTTDAWWRVDPTTGATQAVLEPGTGGGEYVNAVGNAGGRIFADPSRIPQTQAELNQLYRQAIAQVENVARSRPAPTCTIGGSEYSALVCNAVMAISGFVILGAVVYIVAWII